MLYDITLIICLLVVVPLLAILIFVVIDRMKVDTKIVPTNEQNDEYIDFSDKELREALIEDYINSDCCIFVKINSLPKSFKIGNVYFDKCFDNLEYYQEFLSYVVVDGKVYDNGSLNIVFGFDFYYRTTNKDLLNYILDNLDRVEEIKNND